MWSLSNSATWLYCPHCDRMGASQPSNDYSWMYNPKMEMMCRTILIGLVSTAILVIGAGIAGIIVAIFTVIIPLVIIDNFLPR